MREDPPKINPVRNSRRVLNPDFAKTKLRSSSRQAVEYSVSNGVNKLKSEKLKRITNAIALAVAVLIFPKESVAPELTELMKNYETLDYYAKTDRKKYDEVLEEIKLALRQKGGITSSPQLPEEIVKPENLHSTARTEAKKAILPYFIKPELIFGKEFIKNNPEKTEKYFKKIKEAVKASVCIHAKGKLGSGAIVNTKEGLIIVTNAHVTNITENEKNKTKNQIDEEPMIEFVNGAVVSGKFIDSDPKTDVTILTLNPPQNIYLDKILQDTSYLNIDPSPKIKKDETLALIGNPNGYPFETIIVKAKELNDDESKEAKNVYKLQLKNNIVSGPDERFKNLGFYDVDSEKQNVLNIMPWADRSTAIWGMSGGPMIKLDDNGEIKLIGIHKMGLAGKSNSKIETSIGIRSNAIIDLLQKNGYHPITSEQISTGH